MLISKVENCWIEYAYENLKFVQSIFGYLFLVILRGNGPLTFWVLSIDNFADDFNSKENHGFFYCFEYMIKVINAWAGESLEDALRQLYLIDAIDDDGQITNKGRAMSGNSNFYQLMFFF